MPRRTWLSGKMPPVEGGGPGGAGAVCALAGQGKISRTEAMATATEEARSRISVNRGFTSIRVQAAGWGGEVRLPARAWF